MIKYEQMIERLYRSSSLGVKLGLDRAKKLDQALDFPARSYPTVHIAGSNGKGSVAVKIAKVLELSGYHVGLYTSPHLFSFRERITINGQLISEKAVIEGMEKLLFIERKLKLDLTFFELTTFLAFDYFRKEKVDVAVIETGLGGRLDATNVILPVLTVITSISLEHAQILGNDLEQIASEKAGILKGGVPVVLGPKARMQSIYKRAEELHCSVFASKKISYYFDEENTAISDLALQSLSPRFILDPSVLKKGLEALPPCRFEKQGEVIFDVAHNPEAVFYLLQALHHFFPDRKFRFLVGFSKDKEFDRCLDLISSVATHIHLVQAETPRAATVQELSSSLKNKDPYFSSCHATIKEAVQEAYAEAMEQNEVLVICGSFYIMAEAKCSVTKFQFPKDSLNLNEKTFVSVLSSSVT